MGKRKESECSCKECQGMCERVPCWPTPEEAKLLIEQGFSDRLQAVVFYSSPDFYILCPSSKDLLGKGRAPRGTGFLQSHWTGECTFFNKEGLCDLHDITVNGKRVKPLEGRLAHHDRGYDPHYDVAETWNNREAQTLVKKWLDGEI